VCCLFFRYGGNAIAGEGEKRDEGKERKEEEVFIHN
jgi:hypothetical protein